MNIFLIYTLTFCFYVQITFNLCYQKCQSCAHFFKCNKNIKKQIQHYLCNYIFLYKFLNILLRFDLPTTIPMTNDWWSWLYSILRLKLFLYKKYEWVVLTILIIILQKLRQGAIKERSEAK